MGRRIERGGIRLVVEDFAAFQRNLTAASATMRQFGSTAQATASQVSATASQYQGSRVVVEQWSETVERSGDAAGETAQDYTALGIALAAIGTVLQGVVVETGFYASRVEELSNLLEVTRKNAVSLALAENNLEKATSLTTGAVQEQVDGVRDLHLSGAVAQNTVATLIRYNLDWQRATELARLAQDAATFAMQDSSKAVEGLIRGITTLQPRILRTYGLMINLNVAYKKFAEENDILVKNMTVAERQQAAFNEVLAQAPSIAGAYEAAMSTASKQLRSVQTDIADLKEEFGEEFTGVLNAGVGVVRDFIAVLTDLPDPLQAAIMGTTGTAGAMASLGGALLLTAPRLRELGTLFAGLAARIGLSTAAFAGLTAAIPLAVGAIAALNAAEEARRAEAAAILQASEYYPGYIKSLDNAELSSFALTEQLWEQVKAQEASNEAALAGQLMDTQIEMMERLDFAVRRAGGSLEEFRGHMTANVRLLDEHQLAILADFESMLKLGRQYADTEAEAVQFAHGMVLVAQAEIEAREEAAALAEKMIDIVETTDNWLQASGALNQHLEDQEANMSRLRTRVDDYSSAVQEAITNEGIWKDAVSFAVEERVEGLEKAAKKLSEVTGQTTEEIIEMAIAADMSADDLEEMAEGLEAAEEAAEEANAAFQEFSDTLSDGINDFRELGQEAKDSLRDYKDALRDLRRDAAESYADIREKYEGSLPDQTSVKQRTEMLVDAWDEWRLRMGALMDDVWTEQEEGWLAAFHEMTAETEFAFREQEETVAGWMMRLQAAFDEGLLPDSFINKESRQWQEWEAMRNEAYQADLNAQAQKDAEAAVAAEAAYKAEQDALRAQQDRILLELSLHLAARKGLLQAWADEAFGAETPMATLYGSDVDALLQALDAGLVELDPKLQGIIDQTTTAVSIALERTGEIAEVSGANFDNLGARAAAAADLVLGRMEELQGMLDKFTSAGAAPGTAAGDGVLFNLLPEEDKTHILESIGEIETELQGLEEDYLDADPAAPFADSFEGAVTRILTADGIMREEVLDTQDAIGENMTDTIAPGLIGASNDVESEWKGAARKVYDAWDAWLGKLEKKSEEVALAVIKDIEAIIKKLQLIPQKINIEIGVTDGAGKEDGKDDAETEEPDPEFKDLTVGFGRFGAASIGKTLGDALLDAVEDGLRGIADLGGELASIAKFFGDVFTERTLDPIEQKIQDAEDRLEEIYESGPVIPVADFWELANLEHERVILAEQYRKEQERILRLQEQQRELEFLEQQLALLELISEHGLEPLDFLGGVELGTGADPAELLDVMSEVLDRILNDIIAAFNEGPEVSTGAFLPPGGVAAMPVPGMQRATSTSVTVPMTLNTTINNGMDAVIFQAQVENAVRRAVEYGPL